MLFLFAYLVAFSVYISCFFITAPVPDPVEHFERALFGNTADVYGKIYKFIRAISTILHILRENPIYNNITTH